MLVDKYMIKKYLHSLINPLLLVIIPIIINACANPVPPTGGDIDRTPPKVMSFSPPNNMVNFKSPSIEIVFDEYIQNITSANNLIISPALNSNPTIQTKGKKLILNFKDNLKPNTTYTINFGSTVKDFNEGNVYEGLSYVFSTGPYLDSLSLKGKVVNAYDNSSAEGIIVGLYFETTDSILIKSKPDYFVKTDAQGSFSFNNLKQGIYFIAAIDDKNSNYLLDAAVEAVAFNNNPIVLTENIKVPQPLVLFKPVEKIKKTDVLSKQAGLIKFVLNRPVQNYLLQTNFIQENLITYINETRDTILYWYSEPVEGAQFYLSLENEKIDTSKVKMLPLDTVKTYNISGNVSLLPENQEFILFFSTPMNTTKIDLEKITFQNEEEEDIPFTIDFIDNKSIKVNFIKELETSYNLFIKQGAFINYAGLTNQDIAFNAKIIEKEDLPNIILTIDNKLNGTFLLQLLNQDKKEIERVDISSKSALTFENQKVGKYYIRVFQDLNNNQKWDTGNFLENVQPEPVIYFSEPFDLRNNWDKDLTIKIQ
jgi:uncharacterized protein (DUF2141 family)